MATVHSTENGKTRVRLLQSAFGASEGWDDLFDGAETGWTYFLQNLRIDLEKAGPSYLAGSRCSRKNAHVRLVASTLRFVGPTSHAGRGPPPGQECPPPSRV